MSNWRRKKEMSKELQGCHKLNKRLILEKTTIFVGQGKELTCLQGSTRPSFDLPTSSNLGGDDTMIIKETAPKIKRNSTTQILVCIRISKISRRWLRVQRFDLRSIPGEHVSPANRGENTFSQVALPVNHLSPPRPGDGKNKEPRNFVDTLATKTCQLQANRLSKVIDKIVSKQQSAFIAGRQILDGPVILNDIIECYGFGNKLCSWIKACLNSSRASILINGSPTSEFSIKRGLRQGDCIGMLKTWIISIRVLHVFYPSLGSPRVIFTIKYLWYLGLIKDEVLMMSNSIYLGLPIGSNMKSIASWKTLVDRFHMRLSSGKLIFCRLGSSDSYQVCAWRVRTLASLKLITFLFFKMAFELQGHLGLDIVEPPNFLPLERRDSSFYKDCQNILPTLAHATTWDKSIPRKVNVFMWRLSLDRLPHRLNLSSRGMDIPAISCPSCNANVESANHVFFECDIATDMWKLVFRWCDIPLFQAASWDLQ
ncbi:RNA-directed DNA polymerase, eukaryota, reverse transcriptase zinc-binding domain protein [Tanacetum coccineum]